MCRWGQGRGGGEDEDGGEGECGRGRFGVGGGGARCGGAPLGAVYTSSYVSRMKVATESWSCPSEDTLGSNTHEA